ncbi:unnamed protein product [Effrenium voratum]|nr:unnamed protein product [Effrenium voratum]
MEPVAYDECFVPMSPSAASTVADDVGPEGSLGSRRSELPNEDTDGDAPTECPKGPADFLPSQGSTLLRAKALTKLALDAACNRPRAEEKSQVRRLREECQAARRRISCNASSVKATWATGRALEAALLQLEAARGRLRAARKGQQLAVCRQRLEAVNAMEEATDLLEALQTEREALQLLRRELDALDREVAASVEAGAELHGRLRKDLASRRRDLRAEEAGVEFWARKAKQAEEEAKLLCR